jgi:hypothetical protein
VGFPGSFVQLRNHMASESSLLPNNRAAAEQADGAGATKLPRNNERRAPTARETVRTLPGPNEGDFEPHDTIPAPPWLDDELSPEPPHGSS